MNLRIFTHYCSEDGKWHEYCNLTEYNANAVSQTSKKYGNRNSCSPPVLPSGRKVLKVWRT